MHSTFKLINTLALFSILLSNTVFADEPTIKYGQKSYVKVQTINLEDSLKVYIKYWAFLPPENIISNSKSLSNNSVGFSLDVYFPIKATLYIDSISSISFYLIPEDTIEILVDFSLKNSFARAVSFKGRNASVSDYIFNKNVEFGFRNHMEGAKFRSSKIPLAEYLLKIDSLQNTEIAFLTNYIIKHRLPEWFYQTEKWSIIYGKAERKALTPHYRRDMLKHNELIPNHYYSFWEKLPFVNREAKYSYEYYFYLSSYFYYNFLDAKYKMKDQKTLYTGMFKQYFHPADSLLSPEVSDIFLCYKFGMPINQGFIQLYDIEIKKYRTHFHNEPILQILQEFRKNKFAPRSGEVAFNFYLPNDNGQYVELVNFKGKIVLLNFWFNGCTPCVKEVPYEKELVEQFLDKDFVLINIHMKDNKKAWLSGLNKYHLEGVNLFANENWIQILRRNYAVAGYPTYVLIGKEGKIVNPKTIRPSRGVDKEIKKLLLK